MIADDGQNIRELVRILVKNAGFDALTAGLAGDFLDKKSRTAFRTVVF